MVRGNELTDISGIGIELGSSDDPQPSDVGAGNGGCLPIGHIRFVDNYHADQIAVWPCGPAPADLQYSGNVQLPLHIAPSDMPADVLSAAGLQPPYQYLPLRAVPRTRWTTRRSGTPASRRTTWSISRVVVRTRRFGDMTIIGNTAEDIPFALSAPTSVVR